MTAERLNQWERARRPPGLGPSAGRLVPAPTRVSNLWTEPGWWRLAGGHSLRERQVERVLTGICARQIRPDCHSFGIA